MTDDAGQDRVPDVNFPARISTVPLRELQSESRGHNLNVPVVFEERHCV